MLDYLKKAIQTYRIWNSKATKRLVKYFDDNPTLRNHIDITFNEETKTVEEVSVIEITHDMSEYSFVYTEDGSSNLIQSLDFLYSDGLLKRVEAIKTAIDFIESNYDEHFYDYIEDIIINPVTEVITYKLLFGQTFKVCLEERQDFSYWSKLLKTAISNVEDMLDERYKALVSTKEEEDFKKIETKLGHSLYVEKQLRETLKETERELHNTLTEANILLADKGLIIELDENDTYVLKIDRHSNHKTKRNELQKLSIIT